jgi:hypothetical protein
VEHQTSIIKLSGSRSGPDLFGPLDKSGGRPLEAGKEALEAGPDRTCPRHRTSPM